MGPKNSNSGTAFGPSPWAQSMGHFTREGQRETPQDAVPSVLHAGLQSCLRFLICKKEVCLLECSRPSFIHEPSQSTCSVRPLHPPGANSPEATCQVSVERGCPWGGLLSVPCLDALQGGGNYMEKKPQKAGEVLLGEPG